jgi:hypothetical protein
MLQQLRQIKSSELKNLAFSGDFDTLISDATYWLEIKSDNRQVVAEFLGPLQLDERIILHIREPASSSRIHLFSGAAILNLPVSDTVQKRIILPSSLRKIS